MKPKNEKTPSPNELEKEISEFLSKKFGGNVKVVSPVLQPLEAETEDTGEVVKKSKPIEFDLKPEELIAYLDRYIVKQDSAKAILATKICTHFNRITRDRSARFSPDDMVGKIKSNVLLIGPTGVGKTYMIKLIAQKIGVPFVKGDATKFSETGYVGGDVEDLVRDLVREADNDIELAQSGIIYIDEIDKIASSRSLVGPDVSRTGVQRALLKPMEETEVDLKVPHDPISMIQEIENFRRTGKRDRQSVNTRNILFIMSGAFNELDEIIRRRVAKQAIGFGASIGKFKDSSAILAHLKSEDLVEYGFESEFVGRLPVRAVLDRLTEADLYEILRNPNNPIILGKKLDFAAYGIAVKFEDALLRRLACSAYDENTGARGLVSTVEKALLPFEKHLPSTDVKNFPASLEIVQAPDSSLAALETDAGRQHWNAVFEALVLQEQRDIVSYVTLHKQTLAGKYRIDLIPSRIENIARFYGRHNTDIETVVRQIKSYYDEVKKLELFVFQKHHLNIVLEDDAVDFIIEQIVIFGIDLENIYKRFLLNFEYGLNLVRDKTGKNRFFLSKSALENPEAFIADQLK